MDATTYEKEKRRILSTLFPYRILEKTDIMSHGNNLLEINGNEVEITPAVQSSIDKFIGVTRYMAEAMETTYGQKSLADLRNWFALAGNVEKARKIAVIADPHDCKVIGTAAIKKDVITPEAFFDFIELFMDRNGYYPSSVETGTNGVFGINITLKPHHEQTKSFGTDEEYLTNGLYFKWNLGELEAGNYIERLVCTNGATATFPQKMGIINDIAASSVKKLIEIPADQKAMNFNFEILQENALTAQRTVASLSEVKEANKLLLSMGVENAVAEEIAPIQYLMDLYEAAGYKVRHINRDLGAEFKSDILFWDLFNRLTNFASHTPHWEETDIRRHALMSKSFQFLNAPRDIQEYVSIFS